jgi:organizing structure protein 2
MFAAPLSRSLLVSGGAATALAVVSSHKVHCEGTATYTQKKLSIYPEPEAELVLIETRSELEEYIGQARETATAAYEGANAAVRKSVSEWIGVEEAVEKKVKSLIPPDESLTPGLLYVAVATLTGSVIARNRSIAARVILPPALFFASLPYFLPKTSHNVSEYLTSLEREYAPGVAEQHAQLNHTAASLYQQARELNRSAGDGLHRGIGKITKEIRDLTGLQFDVETASRKLTEKVAEARDQVQAVGRDVKEMSEVAEENLKVSVNEKVEELLDKAPQQIQDAVGHEQKRMV